MVKKMQRQLQAYGQAAWLWVQPFKWRLGYFLVFVFFIWYKDFQIQIELNTGSILSISDSMERGLVGSPKNHFSTMNTNSSSINFDLEEKWKTQEQNSQTNQNTKVEPQQRSYVRRFAHIARAEMEKFGIPASITLAQGLLESQAGKSPLAKEANNHFGIKCFSKKCKRGHCKNFSDDSHKDFFRTYSSAWESYRAHSLFLQKDRYKHLLNLPSTDYKSWAVGLKKAGYATDPNYANKLIRLIERLNLEKYDA